MTAALPVVTCTVCGQTGLGHPRVGVCHRCYARALHPVQPCAGCGQTRRHLAAGLCARCYRLSRTRLVTCTACGELRPVHFGDRCERCKRRAAAGAGACAECGKQVARLWAGRCRTCHARGYEITGACGDCGDLTQLTSGLCRACRLFRWKHPLGTCPYCGRQQPIGAAGGCRSCQAALRTARALQRARRKRRFRFDATTGACSDCGDVTRLISGLCKTCASSAPATRSGCAPIAAARCRSARPGAAGPAWRPAAPPGPCSQHRQSAGPGSYSPPPTGSSLHL